MRSGKEGSTVCTGGFSTTSLVSSGPVKEFKSLNASDSAYGDGCLKIDSTKAPCLQFVTSSCMHMPFLPERGYLRERSIDLHSSIA